LRVITGGGAQCSYNRGEVLPYYDDDYDYDYDHQHYEKYSDVDAMTASKTTAASAAAAAARVRHRTAAPAPAAAGDCSPRYQSNYRRPTSASYVDHHSESEQYETVAVDQQKLKVRVKLPIMTGTL